MSAPVEMSTVEVEETQTMQLTKKLKDLRIAVPEKKVTKAVTETLGTTVKISQGVDIEQDVE